MSQQECPNTTSGGMAVTTWLRNPGLVEFFPLLVVLIFVSAAAAAVKLSWTWPIGRDAPLIQYCAFLMNHGKVPYRDIIDMNGVGAYFSSWLEIHAFGYSDLGWRIYDLLFLGLGACGILMIARSFGRRAVALASCLFIIFHIQQGPLELGQGDFQLAICALVGCGLVCEAIRRGSALLLFASGVLFSAGSTIKPTGILLVPVFFLLVIAGNSRCHTLRWSACSAIMLGALIPWLLIFLYLQQARGLISFLDMTANFLPLYTKMRRFTVSALLGMALANLETLFVPMFFSGLFLMERPWKYRRFELVAVASGAACGLLSYTSQGKGWWYHLDPLAAFLCVWCGIGMARLLSSDKAVYRIAATVSLGAFLLRAALPVSSTTRQDYYNVPRTEGLEAEIAHLRSSGKDHGIQVMDTAEGAIHALYDLKILQSTGFLYDFYFYRYPENPFVQRLRERFLTEMSAAPPDLIVIALSSWPDRGVGVARIDRWPELRNFIQSNYSQQSESDWYRIYVRNQ